MKAVIMTLHSDGTVGRLVGPFEDGEEASKYSSTLDWNVGRKIVLLEDPRQSGVCPYTMSHSHEWCGYAECREY